MDLENVARFGDVTAGAGHHSYSADLMTRGICSMARRMVLCAIGSDVAERLAPCTGGPTPNSPRIKRDDGVDEGSCAMGGGSGRRGFRCNAGGSSGPAWVVTTCVMCVCV